MPVGFGPRTPPAPSNEAIGRLKTEFGAGLEALGLILRVIENKDLYQSAIDGLSAKIGELDKRMGVIDKAEMVPQLHAEAARYVADTKAARDGASKEVASAEETARKLVASAQNTARELREAAESWVSAQKGPLQADLAGIEQQRRDLDQRERDFNGWNERLRGAADALDRREAACKVAEASIALRKATLAQAAKALAEG